jgi:hypothetical protein
VNVRPPIVSVPDRAGPVLAAAENSTRPSPVPFAPAVIASQPALLVAVHAQPPGAVTFTLPFPPAAGTFWLVAESETEHPFPCCTVNVCPPAVMAPLRAGPEFAATVNRTWPSPVPLVGGVRVIHETVDAADHAQPLAVRTSNVPCPPLSSMLALVGDSVKVQPWPWVSVKVRPAIASVALRPGPLVAAALYWTSPLPVPAAPEVIVSHDVLLDAVQLQPAPAVTVILPAPPPDPTDAVSGAIVNAHP